MKMNIKVESIDGKSGERERERERGENQVYK